MMESPVIEKGMLHIFSDFFNNSDFISDALKPVNYVWNYRLHWFETCS